MATSETTRSQIPIAAPAEEELDAGWGDDLPEPIAAPGPEPTPGEQAIGSGQPAQTAEQSLKPVPVLDLKPSVPVPIPVLKPSVPVPAANLKPSEPPPPSAPVLDFSAPESAADLDLDLPPDPLSLRVPDDDEPAPASISSVVAPHASSPPDQTSAGLGPKSVPSAARAPMRRQETLVGLGVPAPDLVSRPAPSPPPQVPELENDAPSAEPSTPTLPSPADLALPDSLVLLEQIVSSAPTADVPAPPPSEPVQSVGRPDVELDQWASSVKTKRRRWAIAGGAVGVVAVAISVVLSVGRQEAAPEPPSVAPAASRPHNPQDMARAMAHAAEASQAASAAPAAASVSAAKPPAAVPSGPVSVELDVSPPQTLIFHKGEKLGKSPLKIELGPGEKKDLFLARDGYRPQRVTVDGTEPKVSITLTPYEGTAEQAGQSPPPAGQPKPKPPGRWEPEAFTQQ